MNRSEKVQAGDLQNLIIAYNKEQKPEKHVEDRPEEFAKVNNEAQTKPEIEIPIQSVKVPEREKGMIPAPKPAPCLSGNHCPSGNNHYRADKLRGHVCDVIGVPVNQLPGNECPIERKERMKSVPQNGFQRADGTAEDGLGNTIIKPPPYKIVPVQLTKEQAEEKLTEIVRGYLTPSAQRSWEFAKKAGLHESNLDLFQFFVDGIELQDTDVAEEARA